MNESEPVPDEGGVWRRDTLRIAHLEQDVPEDLSATVYQTVAGGLPELGKVLSDYHDASHATAERLDVRLDPPSRRNADCDPAEERVHVEVRTGRQLGLAQVDRDSAEFGEMSFDFNQYLTANAGIRFYKFDNTLYGFYGFNSTVSSHEGIATCFTPFTPFHYAPCVDLDGRTSKSGNTPKVNLTYKIDKDHMIYATWSKGFRPGGVNRNGGGSRRESDFMA